MKDIYAICFVKPEMYKEDSLGYEEVFAEIKRINTFCAINRKTQGIAGVMIISDDHLIAWRKLISLCTVCDW